MISLVEAYLETKLVGISHNGEKLYEGVPYYCKTNKARKFILFKKGTGYSYQAIEKLIGGVWVPHEAPECLGYENQLNFSSKPYRMQFQ